ncbi:Co2+/Mg2+ efflux protein ApaG [Pseudovibrio exalbescens]|uniref:Protein ApaG n=1 Tax=Pseudovibrio exalbescens TaxID=197461 RepID=A0A1U7JDH8_9HYPH|nr:Co2+/Mg2+ efflux protein ApaG [Pseudovibrio exalbescens]OKL42732.1 Co2+/Mg2+ efflux protein ApaG [Pseudovibrio exalbescens]
MYRSVTRDIQVTVEPYYLSEESRPEEDQYFWAYRVDIENLGTKTVCLRARHWKIIDATGYMQEIRGAGVVGEEPVIEPGECFQYTSGCPLGTPSGIMSGDYQMETLSGERFEVEIPAFSLDMPDQQRTLN